MNAFSFFAALVVVFGLSTSMAGECHPFSKDRDFRQGQFAKLSGTLAVSAQQTAIVINLDQDIFVQGVGAGSQSACAVRSITLSLDERELVRAQMLLEWKARVTTIGVIQNSRLAEAMVAPD